MFRTIEVAAHAYMSAWAPLDEAIARFHAASRSNDEPFHNLIMTLVDAASNGAQLYAPTHFDSCLTSGAAMLRFEMHDTNVFALYTDEKRAEACARICAVYPLWGTMRFPLAQAVEQHPTALALNMGLEDQLILPPDVVHTVARLAMLRRTGSKMAPGSAWEDWVAIMERWYQKKAEPEKARSALPASVRSLMSALHMGKDPAKAAERELQAAAAVMAIPVRDVAMPPEGRENEVAPRILLGN